MFAEEEAKSAAFLQKLTKIKASNKESKKRTIVNQHKLEWHKKLRNLQKRENQMHDEIMEFINKQKKMQTSFLAHEYFMAYLQEKKV